MKLARIIMILIFPLILVTEVSHAESNNISEDSLSNDKNGIFTGWILDKTALYTNADGLSLQRNAAYINYKVKSKVDFDFGVRARYQTKLTPTAEKQIDVRALTIGKQYDKWSWLFGRQLITWGKSDGFRVLDIVNPYDYTEFVLDDMVEAKKALAMLQANYFLNDNADSLQMLIIPEYRRDSFPSPAGEFYPLPPLFSTIQANQTNNPSDFSPSNWQYGLKWEHLGEKISFTLNYLNKWSAQPPLSFNINTGQILSQPVREQLFGGSVDFPWRSVAFRGEFVFSPGIQAPTLSSTAIPEYQKYSNAEMVLGIDYTLDNWFLSAQLFTTKWMDNTLAPVGGAFQNMLTFLVIHNFKQEKFKFHLFGAYDQTNKGDWIEPSLIWDIGKGLESSIGLDIFNGSQQSIFGRFSNNNRVYFSIKWSY